jgi:hypothetical protein
MIPTRHPLLRRKLLWLGVLLLAAALRLIALHDVPPGLAQDEVLDADIAAGILQGRHALFFREGYGHEPLYHYYAAPFQALIGDHFLSSRLPSAILGLLLVALTIRWAQRTWGTPVALVAGLGVAISWWPIVFSRLGIRPIMLPLWLLLAVWHWPHTRRRPWLAASALAHASYSYTPGLVFLVLPFAWWLYELLARSTDKRERSTLLTAVVAVLLWLPLFFYLRANPDLLERGSQLSGPLQALLAGDWRPLWSGFWRTLAVFSVTGDPRWTYMWPNRPIFDPATALLFHGGVLIALWHRRQPRHALLLLWLAIGLLPAILTPDPPATIRLIGAVVPVYLLVGVSADWLWQRLPRPRTRQLLLIGGLLLLALNLWRTVDGGFRQWATAFDTRADKYQSVYLDIARDLRHADGISPVVLTNRYAPIDSHSLRRNLGRDPHARWAQAGQAVVLPGSGNGLLFVPEYVPLDPALHAALGHDPARPLRRSDTVPGYAVWPLPGQPLIDPWPQPVAFGDSLTLLGVQELARESADSPRRLLTWWRVERPLPPDLALFLHAAPAAGEPPLAQHDGLDAAAETLQPGDHFVQLHIVRHDVSGISADLTLTLTLGAYTRHDGTRLQPPGHPHTWITLP